MDVTPIHRRFMALRDILDERSRRLVAAAECLAIGRGGIAAVTRATGMAGQVIRRGMDELQGRLSNRPRHRQAGFADPVADETEPWTPIRLWCGTWNFWWIR